MDYSNFNRLLFGLLLAAGLIQTSPAQAAAISGQGSWETSLRGRDLDGDLSNGYEAYYDTLLNLTWTADVNVAKTLGLGTQGWGAGWVVLSDARYLAAHLSYHGITGWRLPTYYPQAVGGCYLGYSGVGCGVPEGAVASELAHMYHLTLGVEVAASGRGASYAVVNQPFNTGPFWNFEGPSSTVNRFWTDTLSAEGSLAPDQITFSGFTSTTRGYVGYVRMGSDAAAAAWFVRDGDVAAIPEPETYAMMLAGLGLVGFAAARPKRAAVK